MKAASIDALVLWTDDLERSAAFYRALGVPLIDEQHGEGPRHLACELGPVHFALYAASEQHGGPPDRSIAGASQVGLAVGDLEALAAELSAAGVEVVIPLEDVPWGKRMVVRDPDGRPVELNEAPAPE